MNKVERAQELYLRLLVYIDRDVSHIRYLDALKDTKQYDNQYDLTYLRELTKVESKLEPNDKYKYMIAIMPYHKEQLLRCLTLLSYIKYKIGYTGYEPVLAIEI